MFYGFAIGLINPQSLNIKNYKTKVLSSLPRSFYFFLSAIFVSHYYKSLPTIVVYNEELTMLWLKLEIENMAIYANLLVLILALAFRCNSDA